MIRLTNSEIPLQEKIQNRNLILVGSYPKSFKSNSIAIEDLMVNLNQLIKAIGNYKRIFIAPDGDFTKFPFELLRYGFFRKIHTRRFPY